LPFDHNECNNFYSKKVISTQIEVKTKKNYAKTMFGIRIECIIANNYGLIVTFKAVKVYCYPNIWKLAM